MTSPLGGTTGRVLPPADVRRQRAILITVVAVILALLVLPRFVRFSTDLLWFREIGFQSVFWGALFWRATLFALGALATFIVVYINVRLAGGGRTMRPIVLAQSGLGESAQVFDVAAVLPRLLLIGTVAISLLSGAALAARWTTFVMAFKGGDVGLTDPVFARDIGFYLFQLPAISAVLDTLQALAFLSLAAAGALYFLQGAIGVAMPRRPFASPSAARQLGALVAMLFVLTAIRLWWVAPADLLTSASDALVGASYTDIHVRLPALRVAAIAALIAAVAVAYGAARQTLHRYALFAIAGYAGVSIIGRGILPPAVQQFVVTPNELARERPYLERHLAATRAAWGLDSITTRDLSGDAQLTMADIAKNSATIDNVRLWERDLVQQTLSQLQEIRTYYDFVSVTDDRYIIDGKYRQVHLAARELNTASLPTPTFINQHFTFTHGMGITMAPVNQVTSEGLPVLFMKDLPPVSTTSLKLTRPQIYYGQLTTGHVFVGTRQEEFDYPAGDTNVQTNYTGKGGVPVGSWLNRALYAWRLNSLKILLSDDITDSSRIMVRREIRDRARTALPFLRLDTEAYLILTDAGELKWILDAYTASRHYPYAQRTRDGTNYMRSSVKIVIDAYDGTVDAFISDSTDQIVKALDRIFPNVFKPMSAMAPDVRRHIRYPGDLFRTQAVLHATYHMLEATEFYHREDTWQIPTAGARSEDAAGFMRHIVLRLPGEQEPEFIYMIPFTPRGKDNLAAWMVARMDGDHYGEFVVYRFPKQSLVYGPNQVSNRINQDTEIARQLTLWDQRGSSVIRGELLVIPVEESLIYVQPIFLRAEGGTIPELKRVIVVHGNRVVMSETLERGLAELFGEATPSRGAATETARPTPGTNAELLQQAQQHYDRAMAAQRTGNWAEYGREIELLGAVLRRMQ